MIESSYLVVKVDKHIVIIYWKNIERHTVHFLFVLALKSEKSDALSSLICHLFLECCVIFC